MTPEQKLAKAITELYQSLDATWERTRGRRRILIAQQMDALLLKIEVVMASSIARTGQAYQDALGKLTEANTTMTDALESRKQFNDMLASVGAAITSLTSALT